MSENIDGKKLGANPKNVLGRIIEGEKSSGDTTNFIDIPIVQNRNKISSESTIAESMSGIIEGEKSSGDTTNFIDIPIVQNRNKISNESTIAESMSGIIEKEKSSDGTKFESNGEVVRRNLPELPNGYEYVKEISRGGQGVVWLVRNNNINREEAVKIINSLKQKDIDRYFKEINTLAKLDHPNVVTIYYANPNSSYFIMEYLSGGSFEDILKERKYSLLECLNFIKDVCKGLQVAHEKEIIHRDLKPDNILFNRDMIPKIVDFGIVKDVSNATDASIVGTPKYMSPEQWYGEPIDCRSDIWSLGIILYQMITGKTPFSDISTVNLISSMLTKEITKPRLVNKKITESTIGMGVESICVKALKIKKEDRYKNIDYLSNDIEKLLSNSTFKKENNTYGNISIWEKPEGVELFVNTVKAIIRVEIGVKYIWEFVLDKSKFEVYQVGIQSKKNLLSVKTNLIKHFSFYDKNFSPTIEYYSGQIFKIDDIYKFSDIHKVHVDMTNNTSGKFAKNVSIDVYKDNFLHSLQKSIWLVDFLNSFLGFIDNRKIIKTTDLIGYYKISLSNHIKDSAFAAAISGVLVSIITFIIDEKSNLRTDVAFFLFLFPFLFLMLFSKHSHKKYYDPLRSICLQKRIQISL